MTEKDKNGKMVEIESKPERALAVAVFRKGADRRTELEYLDELTLLIETAGAEVIDRVWQEVPSFKKATLLGKGKAEEIAAQVIEEKIDLVVFDEDLSPAQVRNLEQIFNVKVLDRSGIILDIFAKRAKSNEAITQVELAQLQYMLPRLTRLWTHLSKQYGGGVGTRGPGETQIETDRRLIKTRIERLKDKLKTIDQQQTQKRLSRTRFINFALVGYTNAGKSTLMKRLTDADVYIKDELFATLDTTIRAFELPLGQTVLLSDTVGFIRKLPNHLIASFRSTLAEAKNADFLLHMVDVSNPHFRDHIATVDKTLQAIGIEGKKTLIIFNKTDLVEDRDELIGLPSEYGDCVFISAAKDHNIDQLMDKLQQLYDENSNFFDLFIEYKNSHQLSDLYRLAEVIKKEDGETGTRFEVLVQPEKAELFKNQFGKEIIR